MLYTWNETNYVSTILQIKKKKLASLDDTTNLQTPEGTVWIMDMLGECYQNSCRVQEVTASVWISVWKENPYF